jgi:hypothetical protein
MSGRERRNLDSNQGIDALAPKDGKFPFIGQSFLSGTNSEV